MRGSQDPKAMGCRKKTSMIRRWGVKKAMGVCLQEPVHRRHMLPGGTGAAGEGNGAHRGDGGHASDLMHVRQRCFKFSRTTPNGRHLKEATWIPITTCCLLSALLSTPFRDAFGRIWHINKAKRPGIRQGARVA